MALIHAGLGSDTASAIQLLASDPVRNEVERLSMVAKIEDGQVIDVKPLHPLQKKPPTRAVSHARRDLRNDLRGEPKLGRKKPADDISERDKHSAKKRVDILTERGHVAGTVHEIYKRLQKAKARDKPNSAFNNPEPEVIDADKLEARLARAQTENVAQDRGDGALYLYSGGDVATPYDIKKFLTAGMRGDLTHEPTVRLQCAALMAKVLGMLDAKTIERERQMEKLVLETEDDIRKEIEKTKAQMARLQAGSK
jgi:hypothetical protein